ncbi:2-hydroxychromene-2-carboxylate isomerase [Ferrovibrio sp. MS7]|uniref:2-hydroxychromene-2-carboxylate isomerase n=1 Tax=Ferrovibrio plantarum TaxID=3119164 RepID=UPI0031363190
MKQVEFLFDYGSPTCYLAYTQLPVLAAKYNAEILWKPILLGGVHKATGNRSPVEVPAKGLWMFQDLQRFAKRYGVPFKMNTHFPINTLLLMRGAVAMQREGRLLPYSDAIFKAMWVDGLNLNDPQVIGGVLHKAGFDPQALLSAANDEAVKQQLKSETEAAVARGVFGAPVFFVGEAMFFGQDRLDFVAEELAAA